MYTRPLQELSAYGTGERREKIQEDLDNMIHKRTYDKIYAEEKADLRMTIAAIAKSALERRADYPG